MATPSIKTSTTSEPNDDDNYINTTTTSFPSSSSKSCSPHLITAAEVASRRKTKKANKPPAQSAMFHRRRLKTASKKNKNTMISDFGEPPPPPPVVNTEQQSLPPTRPPFSCPPQPQYVFCRQRHLFSGEDESHQEAKTTLKWLSEDARITSGSKVSKNQSEPEEPVKCKTLIERRLAPQPTKSRFCMLNKRTIRGVGLLLVKLLGLIVASSLFPTSRLVTAAFDSIESDQQFDYLLAETINASSSSYNGNFSLQRFSIRETILNFLSKC